MTYEELRAEAREAELKVERRKLLAALERNGWSPQKTAKELEIASSTLYRAVERHPDLKRMMVEKTPPPGRTPTPK